MMRSQGILIALLAVLLIACPDEYETDGSVALLNPLINGVVLGENVPVQVAGCSERPAMRVYLNGAEVSTHWQSTIYDDVWVTYIQVPFRGRHSLRVKGKCGWKYNKDLRVNFNNIETDPLVVGAKVARHFIAQHRATALDWNWEEGILLYGLLRLAQSGVSGADDFVDYARNYHHHYALHGTPTINWADRCPPALSALQLAQNFGDEVGMHHAGRVIDYLLTEPRNRLGSLDHLGNGTLYDILYPDSIWVDSLMMWNVFAARAGRTLAIDELFDFAADQPAIFASVLQSPATGLFYHAWHVEDDRTVPSDADFWLRGNGWVAVSMVEVLEEIGPEHDNFAAMQQSFRALIDGLLTYQLDNGLWDSVVAYPGYTYPESSGSALVAYAMAKGARLGYLPPHYADDAERAYRGLSMYLAEMSDGYRLIGTSGPTLPSNRNGYRNIEQEADAPYGVGAFLLLAAELGTTW